MTTNKTKLTAIVLAQLARESDIPQVDMVEALNLAIKYVKFGADLSVIDKLGYPEFEIDIIAPSHLPSVEGAEASLCVAL
jgi:hypothetical protein